MNITIPKIFKNVPIAALNKDLVSSILNMVGKGDLVEKGHLGVIYDTMKVLTDANPDIKTIGDFVAGMEPDLWGQMFTNYVSKKQQNDFEDNFEHKDSVVTCPSCAYKSTIRNLTKGGAYGSI